MVNLCWFVSNLLYYFKTGLQSKKKKYNIAIFFYINWFIFFINLVKSVNLSFSTTKNRWSLSKAENAISTPLHDHLKSKYVIDSSPNSLSMFRQAQRPLLSNIRLGMSMK